MKSALVFTRTKHRANRLADWLERQGVRAARIHGNRSQSQRTLALEGFKAGRFDVLVATDIAARGIDVAALGHVVNFDVPAASEDYIHRVGRTGRAELTGEAFTFVAPEDEADLRAIERAIGQAAAARPAAGLRLPQKPPEAPPARHEAHPRPPRGPARGGPGGLHARPQRAARRRRGPLRGGASPGRSPPGSRPHDPQLPAPRTLALPDSAGAGPPPESGAMPEPPPPGERLPGGGPSRGRPRATTPSRAAAAATTTPTTPRSRTRRSAGSRSSPPCRCGPAASSTTRSRPS